MLAGAPDVRFSDGLAEYRTRAALNRADTRGLVVELLVVMSLPRPIFKGDLYLVTRRTSGRRFFLKPTRKRTKKIEYCLAVAAKRHGIQVHAVTVMSNHWHCVATDPRGVLPEFLRDVHSWIGKTVNAGIGRWENLWSTSQTSLVRAEGDSNVVERIAYTLANRDPQSGQKPRLSSLPLSQSSA